MDAEEEGGRESFVYAPSLDPFVVAEITKFFEIAGIRERESRILKRLRVGVDPAFSQFQLAFTEMHRLISGVAKLTPRQFCSKGFPRRTTSAASALASPTLAADDPCSFSSSLSWVFAPGVQRRPNALQKPVVARFLIVRNLPRVQIQFA
ncbi:hypothetical protein L596_011114 [Steinernema carpocapsae]|uniref:Uncharacterized protein n=1 Tax=Steinernema carpocapsae TaxID=34508 RepID=A0A4U5NSL0_STECR|nr:hypothetical protein L596_011114 [Steinernema carpocapsae]